MLTRAARKKACIPSPPPLFPDKAPQRSPQPATTNTELTQAKSQKRSLKKNTRKQLKSTDEAIWVQCENKRCLKWRRIAVEAAGSLPDKWYCSMHPDPSLQSCEAPEEQWHLKVNELFTYHGLKEGELVWAKLGKFPPWPAIVSRDPWGNNDFVFDESKEAGGLIYHVEFLGKPPSHTWLPEEMVEPYRDLCSLQLEAPICPREVMASNKKLQTAIHAADNLLLASSSKRLQSLHYTTALYEAEQRRQASADKKKLQTAPLEESKNPRKRPKKQQSTASEVLSSTAAGAAMVPLHTLPRHIQHSVLESQTVLFQLVKPVDGQTNAVQVLTSKPEATSKQATPLAEQNNNQASTRVKQKPSKAKATSTPTNTCSNVSQLRTTNTRPSLAQTLLSCAKQTSPSPQGRKRTNTRALEPTKKKPRKSKGAATQSTNIRQYFTQTASNRAPPSQAVEESVASVPDTVEDSVAATDQVVPTMAEDTLISDLESEMRNGLDEMQSLLHTMTQEDCCSPAQPASSWSVQEEDCCSSFSLAAQTNKALQDLADIEELMKEIG